ncbi:hypothetical protein DICPUDRAFT_146509 [Dictyostelium purpureum]|uniref:Uncharacterized protein n=1 Tax=Dictyostelium purpureum TaxID=5786 RepID=F0Z656_DICPU|nr:uncharacterized protein DICPUDRAFT_146509 [Dictyostelium purpureum]EGC40541.1 hypothetical protein DICPUDRAFT_146509 [Dictyostelium purpureum]|eukprot:XP_003282877.1 hypothetical protein DICPUDRAFT_146509 [Dictyostelium purpureum]
MAQIVEGMYHLRPAFADASLGGSAGGHAFSSNSKDPSWMLGGYNSWVFQQDRGILQVLTNGNIVISGPIVPRDPSSCHTWYVNFMFKTTQAPLSTHEELSPNAYVPKGPIDPRAWKYYTPAKQINSWTATGCNHVDSLEFNILGFDMPLQVGYGANGKNG